MYEYPEVRVPSQQDELDCDRDYAGRWEIWPIVENPLCHLGEIEGPATYGVIR